MSDNSECPTCGAELSRGFCPNCSKDRAKKREQVEKARKISDTFQKPGKRQTPRKG